MSAEELLKEIERTPHATVGQVVREVARRTGQPEPLVAYRLLRLWKEGKVTVYHPRARGPLSTLLTVDGAWYWTAMAVTLAAGVLAGLDVATPLRVALGGLLALFMPGYAVTELLYPRGDERRPLERLAMSIGLSLAISPLAALTLNYTPWGIRPAPVAALLTAVTATLLTLAHLRKVGLRRRYPGG